MGDREIEREGGRERWGRERKERRERDGVTEIERGLQREREIVGTER